MQMLNPFNPQQDSDPSGFFAGLRFQNRLFKTIDAAKVDDQIFQVIQDAFEEALKKDHLVILPETAKQHLLAQAMKHVLGNMLTKLDDKKPTRFM